MRASQTNLRRMSWIFLRNIDTVLNLIFTVWNDASGFQHPALGANRIQEESHTQADEVRVVIEEVQWLQQYATQWHDDGGYEHSDRHEVVAISVPICARRTHAEKVVQHNLLLPDHIVLCNLDAHERPDEATEGAQRIVDDFGVVVQLPRHTEHRANSGDGATHLHADSLRVDIGEVKARRQEVSNDVDAHRGNGECQSSENRGCIAVDLINNFDRVIHELAKDFWRRCCSDDNQQCEEKKIDWATQEVPLFHRSCRCGVASKVPEVQHRSCEERDDDGHRLDRCDK
mmetsp:Transcript_74639/g.194080  ORF Transcript_74639/g.194080 Transcript_74639/m.194080 type:complete len:287 (-) Transcript_74639:824-1684(-)